MERSRHKSKWIDESNRLPQAICCCANNKKWNFYAQKKIGLQRIYTYIFFFLSENSILCCPQPVTLAPILVNICSSVGAVDSIKPLPHISICWYARIRYILTIHAQFNLNPFIIHYWSACRTRKMGAINRAQQYGDAHRQVSLVLLCQCVNWEIKNEQIEQIE